jgi:glycosyltransferase involved in cell wall biosynthesis
MDPMKNKMKISVFGSTDPTYSIARYVRELARSFPSCVEVTPVQYAISKALLRKQIDRYWGYTRYAMGKQGDFNVIATEAHGYLLSVLPGRRTICVCHDMHGLTYTGPRTAQYHFYHLRYRYALRFLKKAKFVVTVSYNTKRQLLEFCPFLSEEQVIPVHSGLDDHWRRPVSKELRDHLGHKYHLQDKQIVLHVGDDLWYKNVAGLIRAFARLNNPDLVLVQIGNLTMQTLSVAAGLKVDDRIVQLTGVTDGELAALYQMAEVLVVPSFTEGFGWPPLEAMACGCPTVCSNAETLREICGDASVFVDPCDTCDMAGAISMVLSDGDLRQRLIDRGHTNADRFSWPAAANEFLELFQRD